MELTINVGKNVAEKIRLISKLGGLNSTDLDATLSEAVDTHLSLHLIKLTREMLSSVGVHAEEIPVGAQPARFYASPLAEPYQTTEELGGDIDTFDEINKTSEGSLTTKVEIPSDTEVEEVSAESIEDALEEDEDEDEVEVEVDEEVDEFKADGDSWQAGLMEEADFDFGDDMISSAPSRSNVAPASYNDSPLAEGGAISTPDVLPVDLGINNVSVESGSMKGSVDFMTALLNGAHGNTSLRNSSRV